MWGGGEGEGGAFGLFWASSMEKRLGRKYIKISNSSMFNVKKIQYDMLQDAQI
jgi:hypothetical protein